MARIIDNLDPWANVWEDVGKNLGAGLMDGWKKGKLKEELGDLDFSNPSSMYEVSRKFLEMGDWGRAADFYKLGSELEYNLGRVAAERAKAAKGSDIGQMTEATRKSIEGQVKDAFKSSGWLPDIGDPENLPEGYTLDSMVEQIFAVSQKYNISIPDAIKAFQGEYAQAAGITRPAGGRTIVQDFNELY